MEISHLDYKHCELFTVVGRVDSFSAPRLAQALADSTSQNRFNLILDLGKVDYVSSAGLRVLIDVQKTCKYTGRGEIVLVGVPKRIFETLELAGFISLFKFFDDLTSAVAHF